ncbi:MULTISPECIES: GntR family transcriptional regulator [unclassified Nocardia]|uniref:GntR family transcriptional regulator n=1 Tax=unclassified Nocardia TaxID=2637762 RepID=UPI001CE4727B|nr:MULTISPECIES: GntR family transcriptional regulator [unclassified Nocardia]
MPGVPVRHQPDLLLRHPEPVTMMERAYRTVKRAIIELDRPPGARFTEQEIARTLGLSKTPVREALARLHRDGLVAPLPRSGYVVSAITLADVANLCDMRTLLQTEAAGLCATRRLDAESTRRLDELSIDDDEKYTGETGFEDRLRANYEYEAIIANGSGNDRLAMAVVTVLDEIERVARLVARLTPTLPPERTRQRIAVTEAVRQGNPIEARAAMRVRTVSARDEILRTLLISPAVTTTAIPVP